MVNDRTFLTAGLVAMVFSCGVAHAATETLTFTRIEPSNAPENIESQLFVDVSDVIGDATKVDFTFRNEVGIASSVSEVYFDNGDAGPLMSGAIESQTGTSFTFGSAAPPVLPGGANLTPAFEVSPGLAADTNPGPPANGINTASDELVIRMMLIPGMAFGDVIAALEDGALRIGMHVRSIGVDEESDAFVNGPPGVVIPTPTAGAWGLAGLALIGARRRR